MKKKGFTLIELLSVIIVLAIIALVATPIVLNVIEKSNKEALKDSAYGLINSARFYYLENELSQTERFDIRDSEVISQNKITFQGEIENGIVLLNEKGEVALCINKDDYSAYKNYKDTNVMLVDNKNCDIPTGYSVVYLAGESTIKEYTNQELTDIVLELQSEIEELKNSSSSDDGNPAGTVISYMGNNAPEGYLSCDGSVYNISDYPTLAEQIKTEFGSYNYYGGDGVTTFAVPDLRGEFLRGTGTNSHTNQGNGANVGVHQDATEHLFTAFIGNHLQVRSRLDGSAEWNFAKNIDKQILISDKMYYNTFTGTTASTTTDLETSYTSRPTNTSVLYCIKY